MYFSKSDDQWISCNAKFRLLGDEMKGRLMEEGIKQIPAGTVMVFIWNKKEYLMFQILEDIHLEHTTGTSLIAFEPGSFAFMQHRRSKDAVPTLRFRDCGMPTLSELGFYKWKCTV